MPLPPELSTVHSPRPLLNVCDSTTEGAGVPVAVMVATPPLHKVVTEGVSAGANGGLLTVKVTVDGQPAAIYVMIAVPTDMPATLPDASTVAIPVLLLLHVPAPVASLRGVDPPMQVADAPVTGKGSGFTAIVIVAEVAVVVVTQLLEVVITQYTVFPFKRLGLA